MINLDLALIITVAVLFLFMVSALNGMLFKPMVKHIDARKKSLAENQQNASQSSGDASELLSEAKKILDDARHEAHSYLEAEVAKQKESNANLISKVKGEIEEEIKSFRQELEVEKEKVKQAIVDSKGDLTQAIKAKLAV